jgi:two-component system, NarL family, sensor kinase
LSGLAIVVLLGLAGVELLRHTGSAEALRDAKNNVRLAAEGVAAPNLTAAVLRGDPSALARFDRIMRSSVVRPPIVRVKIWSAGGRIVYSDARQLIGSSYALGAGELAILRRGGVDADLSDLSRPENRFERRQGKLLEVYLPILGPGGQPLLFEGYERQSSVLSSSRRLWLVFAPALVGALLLLQLLQLPLASSLVRRVRRAGAEREALLRRAVEASDLERRRLASILHDGVVQDLTGVSYRLAARGAEPGDQVPAALAREASGELRRSVQELRSLLVDLYPGGLHGADLGSALAELAAELERDGVLVMLDVELDGPLPEVAAELVFRAAREGVRNVLRHAGAGTVAIRVTADAQHALLEVEDDGAGLETGVEPLGPKQGHFGLALLRDVLNDSGGDLQLLPGASGGALLRARVPLG